MIYYLLRTMKYLSFALLFLFASAAGADDFQTQRAALESEKVALDSDIRKLNIQITQTDSMAAVEKQYGNQQQVKQKADLERRQTEIEDLKGKLSELSAEMQRERNSVSFSQTQIDNVEATRKALGSQMASHCRKLEVFIKSSLPWDSESRIERVATLCRDLENGSSGAEEGFSRLKAMYAEEIRFGDEVQVSNRPITRNDGEVVNASVLRIGNQWIVYQDDAGHLFGVLNRKIGSDGIYEYAWKEDLSFEERQAIKNAIDVKLSRKPPQMVKLPLSLSVLGK
jgi:predicted RNase H-like nuclease (RuvC/YqgF family)